MSDCHDCDNAGFTWEFVESPEDELEGEWHQVPCRNWRHRVRPTLHQIAAAYREGREPPSTYSVAVADADIPF
jgi:hypothetical protein